MARHKQSKTVAVNDPALDISSLIDVCFLLLIYFIVTSVITPREQDLDYKFPRSDGTVQTSTGPMLIHIDSVGTVSATYGEEVLTLDTDAQVRELPLLNSQLELYASGVRAAGDTPLVQINASPETTQQRVIDVLNALAGVGIDSITFTDKLSE